MFNCSGTVCSFSQSLFLSCLASLSLYLYFLSISLPALYSSLFFSTLSTSVYLSIYLSIYLSNYLSIYLSIYLRRGGWILVRLCIVAALTANLAVTGLLTAISSYNYPGGHAIAALHQLEVGRGKDN